MADTEHLLLSPKFALRVPRPAVYFSAVEVCFPRRPRSSAEGVASQGRLNLLAHNVVSPLGDGTPFAPQQEISLLAPKAFLVPHPPPFYKLCFIM